jgi:antitoxin ParD1/3/4
LHVVGFDSYVGSKIWLWFDLVTIQISRPEIEALIQQRLHSGAFENVEDVLLDALEIQREREAWLLENKAAIEAKIEHGLAQLDRGEGIPGDQLRSRLAADKAAFLAERSRK